MEAFAALYSRLDGTNSTTGKVAALKDYLRDAPPGDAAWAVHFLTGHRPRRAVPARMMRDLACNVAGIPVWLFDESYEAVGDLAETVAHLLPRNDSTSDRPLTYWIEERLLPIAGLPDAERAERVLAAWRELDWWGTFVWNKLITGEFRVGVSARLVMRAIAEVSNLPPDVIAQRLAGGWQPGAEQYQRLISPDDGEQEASRPYPLFLAHPLQAAPETLGAIDDWQIEWKWDGIRAQLLRRNGQVWLWSRGDEVITDSFPELAAAGRALPDGTVLDGEVLVWGEDRPENFGALQKRLGRNKPGAKLLTDAPATLIAYDLLEWNGIDWRMRPQAERRAQLEDVIATLPQGTPIRLSPLVEADDWSALAQAREDSRARGVEGMMLKRRDAPYGVGRPRGVWWKWKIDPYSVDAVLIYAQRGSGRRASLYTDYTFGLWSNGQLVPFAKAYSGLTDAEIREVDRYVREHTLERIGPVRVVEPGIVCELAFEGIQASSRHKAGIAVRFPRIARLRKDKGIADADLLDTVRAWAGAPAAA